MPSRRAFLIGGGAAGLLGLLGVNGLLGWSGQQQQLLAAQQQLLAAGPVCGVAGEPGVSGEALRDIPRPYLALYRAAPATDCPGLPWAVLAGIGKVESDHGRSTLAGVHSGANPYGAAGPMQIGIGGKAGNTWAAYGDGVLEHVYDPVYAIPAAARYLAKNGAPSDIRAAVFAYNHADWYVNEVLGWATKYTGSGTPPADCVATPLPDGVAGQVIAFALAQIGKPYIFGASGPDAFDCSGLTMASYRAAGVPIPRTAAAQWAGLPHLDLKTPPGLQPADLIYFDVGPDRPGIDHCGIVYQPQAKQMIVARHAGTLVQIQSYAGMPTVGFARPQVMGR
jgi:cell wall-associated NlpC family hydrolase